MSGKLEAALAWAARGFRCFPLQAGTKLPLEQGWIVSATTEPDVIRSWWLDPVVGAERDHNIGFLTSHHVVLDVDTKAGKPGLDTFFKLGLEFDTLTTRTPTGGYHLVYAAIGREVGQAPLGLGIDVRSRHGYVVAPGSTLDVVDGDGGPVACLIDVRREVLSKRLRNGAVVREATYAVEIDLPVAEFPHELRPLLKPPRARRAERVSVDLDQPEALEIAAHWLRREAAPAVQGENGDDATYRVACLVRDFGVSECMALDLMLDHWNQRCEPPWDPGELSVKVENAYRYATGEAGSASPAVQFDGVVRVPLPNDARAAHDSTHKVESDPWYNPDLSLLGSGRRPAPAFPTELLGPFWSTWASSAAAAASAPVDYVGLPLLAITVGSFGQRQMAFGGHRLVRTALALDRKRRCARQRKKPRHRQGLDLLRHAEDRMCQGFDQVVREHELKKQTAKAKREEWETKVKVAVKAGDIAPEMPIDAENPAEPVRPRIRVVDCTVERLAALAHELPRGLLVVRDELAGWLGGFDKYGGGGSDRAFAVEMYGGRGHIVDRVKNPMPITIRHLSVGVLGGVQPEKLTLITDSPDDGLAARILWAWPDAQPTFKLAREPFDSTYAKEAFGRLIDLSMDADAFGYPEPRRVRLSREAEEALEAFAREMADKGSDAYGLLVGVLGKARGHALRLSAVLEFLWWSAKGGAEPEVISVAATRAAITLMTEYFVPMAQRVYGDAAIPKVERAAMALARHIKNNRLTSFNARDTRRVIGGMLREPKAMDAACEALAEAGLIRPEFARVGGGGGRLCEKLPCQSRRLLLPVMNGSPQASANRADSANRPILKRH